VSCRIFWPNGFHTFSVPRHSVCTSCFVNHRSFMLLPIYFRVATVTARAAARSGLQCRLLRSGIRHNPAPRNQWSRPLVTAAAGFAGLAAISAATVAMTESSSSPRVSVYDLPLGDGFPRVIPCFIEVAKGSRNKYEWDDKTGFLRLDRVLHSAVFYPHNYGFYPQTLCGDGDPLDVLVLGEELVPGAIVDVRAIGYMIMEDEKGLDEKVLAVPVTDPRFDEYKTLRDVPEHLLREIAHFFGTYKALEKKKWAKVGGWKGTEDTLLLIEQTHTAYVTAKADPKKKIHRKDSEKKSIDELNRFVVKS